MKKLLSLVLVMAILSLGVMSFASCSSKGKIVVATSPDFPPFEYLEGKKVVGIEVEIMQKICEKLGKKVVFKQIDFDSILVGVASGKFDCGMSGITVTDARKENTLFTDPYCLAAQAIVVKAGSPITCKADLTGKKIAVQTATTAEDFCLENGYDILAFQANPDAELALVNGNVDAWVIDDLTAAEMVKEYNEGKADADKLVILSEAMTTEPYAFAFAFGNEELVAEINKIQKEMLEDGTIAAIFAKYEAPYTAPTTAQ